MSCISDIYGQHLVRGVVLDKYTKEPLIGASLLEKGTNSGTVSDFDGSFELTVQGGNSVLEVFSIGFVKEEVEIKERTDLEILLEGDCTKCWFDSPEINLFIYSGLFSTPFGGALEVSSPVLFHEPVLRFLGKFQADFRNNNFLNLRASLNHLLSSCRFDSDISFHYNRFRFEGPTNLEDYSVAVNLNWSRNINPVLGIKSLSFAAKELQPINNKILYGIGVRSLTIFPALLEINSIVYFDNTRINYNAELRSYYKGVDVILEFYKFREVAELSLGFGYEFRYLSKSQKAEYQQVKNGR